MQSTCKDDLALNSNVSQFLWAIGLKSCMFLWRVSETLNSLHDGLIKSCLMPYHNLILK